MSINKSGLIKVLETEVIDTLKVVRCKRTDSKQTFIEKLICFSLLEVFYGNATLNSNLFEQCIL